jgi:hypothetical protein
MIGIIAKLKAAEVMVKALLASGSTIADFFKKFADEILLQPLSLDDVVEAFSSAIDKFILDVEQKESLKFYGGKLKIKVKEDNPTSIIIGIDLFFQNEKQEWIKKTTEMLKDKKFLEESSYKELLKDKERVFDIEHP